MKKVQDGLALPLLQPVGMSGDLPFELLARLLRRDRPKARMASTCLECAQAGATENRGAHSPLEVWLVKKQVLTVAIAVTLGAVGMAFGRTLATNVANDTERSVICRCDRNCNCDRECRPIDGCR